MKKLIEIIKGAVNFPPWVSTVLGLIARIFSRKGKSEIDEGVKNAHETGDTSSLESSINNHLNK